MGKPGPGPALYCRPGPYLFEVHMKIQIKNCVTDPNYKELRKAGTPIFKPVVLGQTLVPGAIRVVDASSISYQEAKHIDSLVKSGCLVVKQIGIGSVSLVEYLGYSEPVLVEPPPAPVVEEVKEIIPEEPVEEETTEAPEEEPSEDSSLYTESDLLAMKNAELRAIALELDSDAQITNKSKKKLVTLILGLQNG